MTDDERRAYAALLEAQPLFRQIMARQRDYYIDQARYADVNDHDTRLNALAAANAIETATLDVLSLAKAAQDGQVDPADVFRVPTPPL